MVTTDVAWDELLIQHDSDDTFVVVVDSDFILRAASPAIGVELQIDPREVIGASTADLIHPDDLLRALDVFRGNPATPGLRPANIYRIRTQADGVYRTFGVTGESVLEGAAMVLRLREPTERARSELLALEQIDIFEMMGNGRSLEDCLLALVVMVERNSDGARAIIHIADEEGKLQPVASDSLPTDVVERFREAPANAPGGGLQQALLDRPPGIAPSRIPSLPTSSATVARRSDGTIAGYLEVLHPRSKRPKSTDAGAQRMVCRLIGLLTDRYAFESRPTEASLLDDLTGFPNRRALRQTADELDKDARTYGLLALSLDDFDAISGDDPEGGERALVAVAQAIRFVLSDVPTAFRSGGDEFVVIVPNERRAESLAALGQQILDALEAQPVDLATTNRPITASIGASTQLRAEGGQLFSELLGEADTAMCVAKRDGGQQVRIHDQPLDSRWVHRKALAESLPRAIAANELYLEFQPIISLSSHYVVGFEALSRWKHPRFGTLSPGDFLPIAEETSLIHAVDTWVLNTAAREIAGWNAASKRPLDVWVNLSARSLARPDLVHQILGLQERYRIDIGVELTERDSFASSLHADRACEQLGTAGIKLALDDFGVGRSSLFRAVFHRPSVLKIDRSFVNGMLGSESMMAMVSAILDIGRQLDIDVVAEGVESEAQMRQLEIMGCELAQGYLFAAPLTADVIERRLGPDFDDLRVVKLSAANETGHDLDV